MKNKTKLSKRIVAFFVFMIFTLNSFAAVVSDNDGRAFVTKVEFDSLRHNFQTQLDAYNTGIDSKMDTAIAAYLAGIKIGNTVKFLSMPNSVLDFPLTIKAVCEFDYNKHYGEGAYNYASGVAQWTPYFNFRNTVNRKNGLEVFTSSNQNAGNVWNDFYNYSTTETVSGKKYAIVDAIYKNYNALYNATNWIMSFNQSAGSTGNFKSYLVCGITPAFVMTASDASYGTGRTYNLVNSGTLFGTAGKGTAGSKLNFDYALTYNWTMTATESLSNTAPNKRKWTASSDGWQIATAAYNQDYSWVVEYDEHKLNQIYNVNGLKIPVLEKGIAKLTNYHTAFRNLYSGIITMKDIDNNANFLNWTCTWYDSPNYTIADVDHCDKTDQFDTSFINSDNFAYKVTDETSGITYTQPMTSGIFMGNMQEDGILDMTLELTYTGVTNANVIIRKEPISDVDLTNAKNVLINYDTYINQKYAEIKSATPTKLSFAVNKNDDIYIKVINPAANTNVVLKQPLMYLTIKSD